MRPLPPLLALMLCLAPSCDKARDLAGRFAKKAPATAPAATANGSWVSQIPEGGYDSFRLQPDKVAIVDFYADWCGPCRKLAPILEQIAADHAGSIVIGKVNVDQHGELAAKEGVRGIPDVRIFRNGKQVDQFVGLPPENEVRRRIEIHAKGLPAPAAAAGDGKPSTREPTTRPMPKDWLPQGMQRR
jgi:thioredoxin